MKPALLVFEPKKARSLQIFRRSWRVVLTSWVVLFILSLLLAVDHLILGTE